MLPLHTDGGFSYYQIGVISHSEECAKPNVPGINTNVQFFAEWIQEKVAVEIVDPKKESSFEDWY